jgi:flagellar basal-body rod modification protein FlgD
MAITSVNAYYNTTTSPVGQSTKESKSELDFNDLLKIIVTQLSQQDPEKAASTTDLVNQYMGIANLQASTTVKTSAEETSLQSRQNYAVNLINKKVTVLDSNNSNAPVTGIVESSRIVDKTVYISIGGNEYDASQIQNYLQ